MSDLSFQKIRNLHSLSFFFFFRNVRGILYKIFVRAYVDTPQKHLYTSSPFSPELSLDMMAEPPGERKHYSKFPTFSYSKLNTGTSKVAERFFFFF